MPDTKQRYVPTPEQRAKQEAQRAAQKAAREQRVQQNTAPKAAQQAVRHASEVPGRSVWGHIRHIPRTWPISAAGAAVAVGGVHHLRHQEQRQSGGDRSRGAAVGGAAGAGGALTTYHMGGKATKFGIQHYRSKKWEPKTHNPIWAEHQRAHNVGGKTGRTLNDLSFKQRGHFYEKYPLDLPGGRAQRLLALKNRRSVGVATVAAGGLLGAGAGQRRKSSNVTKHYTPVRPTGHTGVGKRERLVRETTHTSPVRAAGVAAGAGLLALGVPRLGMTSRGLAMGAERAAFKGRPDISQLLRDIEAVRREMVQGGNHVVRQLPPSLQSPGIQTIGGGLLINRSLPVTHRKYEPVAEY